MSFGTLTLIELQLSIVWLPGSKEFIQNIGHGRLNKQVSKETKTEGEG